LNAGSQFRANCAVTIDSLISAFNVIQFGDFLPSDILVDEIPEGSLRPQRPSTTSYWQIALFANAVLSLQALVVGSIWLGAAEELSLSLKVPVIASINQQCCEIWRRTRKTNGR
jgi:hypothetical protein